MKRWDTKVGTHSAWIGLWWFSVISFQPRVKDPFSILLNIVLIISAEDFTPFIHNGILKSETPAHEYVFNEIFYFVYVY